MFAKNYAEYYDLFNQSKPYEEEIKFVYRWAENPKSIFDIGAGTGSYWKYYPPKIKISGIDLSKEMLKNGDKRIVQGDITKYKHAGKVDCVTALFDVLNYVHKHDWWENLPLGNGGYFIFDIWDKEKVDKQGFSRTAKSVGNVTRIIKPIDYDGREVMLQIDIEDSKGSFSEIHRMYLYSQRDIERFCGNDFDIFEIKPTGTWQLWFKLKRK